MNANAEIKLLDVVAMLRDLPEKGLLKGHVGTVVELLDPGCYLVEFSDDEGRAYAFAPLTQNELLPLHYAAESALAAVRNRPLAQPQKPFGKSSRVIHLLDARGLRRFDPAVLPFSDPAIQFGAGGLFETLRVEAGCAHLFNAHCERLLRSAAFWKIAPPAGPERWLEAIAACVKDAPPVPAYRARMTLGVDPNAARNSGAQPSAVGMNPGRMFFEVAALSPDYLPSIRERRKFSLVVFRDYHFPSDCPWTGHKSTQYYAHWEARRRARAAGADEPILLNECGGIAEAGAFNIFWIEGDALHTPHADCGGLPGVFAARVREIACRLGIDVKSCRAPPEELLSASGVFITNSLAEIIDVAEIDGQTVPSAFASPLGARLAEAAEADRPARADGLLPGHGL